MAKCPSRFSLSIVLVVNRSENGEIMKFCHSPYIYVYWTTWNTAIQHLKKNKIPTPSVTDWMTFDVSLVSAVTTFVLVCLKNMVDKKARSVEKFKSGHKKSQNLHMQPTLFSMQETMFLFFDFVRHHFDLVANYKQLSITHHVICLKPAIIVLRIIK